MEALMQYIWQHRLWRSGSMTDSAGERVRVIDPGLLNTDAGPDFFNAKVEIDGRLWVGCVEIHERATDWHRHGHDRDKAYDSVILHVVGKDDCPVRRTNGELIPQVVLDVSPSFNERYQAMMGTRTELPCASRLAAVPHIIITEWMEGLAFERLHGKVERIGHLLELYHGSWEDVCYVTLARTLGFGINSEAFERLARSMPLRLLGKHSDSLLQQEALLFGQAGLLGDAARQGADPYCRQLCQEWQFLQNKFQLTPLPREAWKLFRIRPQSFPYRRIALLAHYLHDGFRLMHRIVEADSEDDLRELFNVQLTGYWADHYTFGKPASHPSRALSNSSIDIVLINTVAPLLYARGSLSDDYSLTDRAVTLLQSLKPEHNSIVTAFTSAGIDCQDALTSQALIELRRSYCDARKCIYCKIGHHLLSQAAKMD